MARTPDDSSDEKREHADRVSKLIAEFNQIAHDSTLSDAAIKVLVAMRLKLRGHIPPDYFGSLDVAVSFKNGSVCNIKVADTQSFQVDKLS